MTENVERKKGAKGFLEDYDALDDDEFETPGVAKQKKLLSKYDDIDVISGDQNRKEKKKFTLGAEGNARGRTFQYCQCRQIGFSFHYSNLMCMQSCKHTL